MTIDAIEISIIGLTVRVQKSDMQEESIKIMDRVGPALPYASELSK